MSFLQTGCNGLEAKRYMGKLKSSITAAACKGVGRKIFREGGNEKNTENSTFKPLSTIFVSCMKIQGMASLPPAADAHGCMIFVC